MKIIPIDTDILKKIISERSYNELYNLFDKAYKSQIPDPEWFEKKFTKHIKDKYMLSFFDII